MPLKLKNTPPYYEVVEQGEVTGGYKEYAAVLTMVAGVWNEETIVNTLGTVSLSTVGVIARITKTDAFTANKTIISAISVYDNQNNAVQVRALGTSVVDLNMAITSADNGDKIIFSIKVYE